MEGSIDLQRTAQAAWAINQFTVDLHRSNQDCRGKFFPLRHDVKTMVHPVNKIDVGATGRAKHDVRSGSPAFRSMARLIVRPDVGFDFNDPAGNNPLPIVAHQIFPNQ